MQSSQRTRHSQASIWEAAPSESKGSSCSASWRKSAPAGAFASRSSPSTSPIPSRSPPVRPCRGFRSNARGSRDQYCNGVSTTTRGGCLWTSGGRTSASLESSTGWASTSDPNGPREGAQPRSSSTRKRAKTAFVARSPGWPGGAGMSQGRHPGSGPCCAPRAFAERQPHFAPKRGGCPPRFGAKVSFRRGAGVRGACGRACGRAWCAGGGVRRERRGEGKGRDAFTAARDASAAARSRRGGRGSPRRPRARPSSRRRPADACGSGCRSRG